MNMVHPNEGWRELGFGSDAALLIWASSRSNLLHWGARAVVCFSGEYHDPSMRVIDHRSVTLEGPDFQDRFIRWLNEVNYLLSCEHWVCWETRLVNEGGESITCKMRGFSLDPDRDRLEKEIKAITRHRPYLGKGKDGTWVAKVVVDL